jgi:hypothetical protein
MMDRFELLKVLALEKIAEMGKAAKIASVCLAEIGFDRKQGTVFQLETVAVWAEAERLKLRQVHES